MNSKFKDLESLWQGRKYKNWGRRIYGRIWTRFIPEEKRFEVYERYKRWSKTGEKDEQGHDKYKVEFFGTEPFFHIYEDGTTRIRLKTMFDIAQANFLRYHGIQVWRGRSIKTQGIHYEYMNQRVVSDGWVQIGSNGHLSADEGPKIRIFDKPAQRKLNALIREVRYMIRIRQKMGAFAGLTVAKLREWADKKYEGRWTLDDDMTLRNWLERCHEGDLESFYPILYLATRREWSAKETSRNWENVFNLYIKTKKNQMMTESGVVTYK